LDKEKRNNRNGKNIKTKYKIQKKRNKKYEKKTEKKIQKRVKTKIKTKPFPYPRVIYGIDHDDIIAAMITAEKF